MTQPDHREGLKLHKGNSMVSVLFMITSPEVTINEDQIEIANDRPVIVFSDRPHRIAKELDGGVKQFASIFLNSDFTSNPPNVTFAGYLDSEQKEQYTVFEMGSPLVGATSVLFPIIKPIGDEKPVPSGKYSNVSLIVDNFWDVVESIGGVIGTVAAGIATVGACTVGEVATAGLDTGACVAGVAGTIGAGAATAGSIGNQV